MHVIYSSLLVCPPIHPEKMGTFQLSFPQKLAFQLFKSQLNN
uniref:Uncharacterized protein n=1 Tax=Arundo donax TaxID=35708 RepID=A0A0A9FLM4_ARUDO